jgi:hypothetical protein
MSLFPSHQPPPLIILVHFSNSSLHLPLISFSSPHISPLILIFLWLVFVLPLAVFHLPGLHFQCFHFRILFIILLFFFFFIHLFRLLLLYLVSYHQARSQRGARSAVQPLGICKISRTNMLISPLKTCVTQTHPRVASVEPPRLETTQCQIRMHMHDVCNVIERIIRA